MKQSAIRTQGPRYQRPKVLETRARHSQPEEECSFNPQSQTHFKIAPKLSKRNQICTYIWTKYDKMNNDPDVPIAPLPHCAQSYPAIPKLFMSDQNNKVINKFVPGA